MAEEKKRTTYTVAGEFMGRFVSVPNHETSRLAYEYAYMKGWTNFRVIRG